tara:strand:+ start:15 stop:269 length:255 start_codon:yes stop_codon:yes gene_type:complete
MESIKEFPRGITDQAISDSTATANDSVRSGPGYKLQVTSYKLPGPRPISNANKGLIHKRQASSHKLQATSNKLQALGTAASSKR